MRGVRGRVPALVVRVDGDVEAHELVKGGVVEAQHAVEVGRVVERRVLGAKLAVMVLAAVDERGDLGQARDEVHRVLVHELPVLGLGGASGVLLGEDALRLQGEHRDGQLSHWVHCLWEGADERLHMRWQRRAVVEILGDHIYLCLGRDFTREQQPEEALGEWLVLGDARESGQLLLQLRDRVAAEADALLRVEQRCFPDHALDAARATQALVEGYSVDELVTVILLHLLPCRLLRRNLSCECLLEAAKDRYHAP
mmetsp:Transcript_9421/g.27492  ORF Transcript_9421/g.27492 Transcript_9421/m.27492 type:complete len:255 (+) Transcript_9421:1140-1904(+)